MHVQVFGIGGGEQFLDGLSSARPSTSSKASIMPTPSKARTASMRLRSSSGCVYRKPYPS
jgi:hypothetical protein